MWNKINSPIVITIIAIAAVFILKATMKPKLASEIRGVYTEIEAIVEDGASDAQKSRAIKEFAQEIATQMREGFEAGFSQNKKKDNKDKVYLAAKQKIDISDIKFVESKWPEREKIVFKVKNNSEQYLNSLKLNYEFYKQGEIIDCENKWIHDIKIFEPGQEVALSYERHLPKEDIDNCKSDDVKIKVTSFDIKQID